LSAGANRPNAIKPLSRRLALALVSCAVACSAAAGAAKQYPRVLANVPLAFRGSWDEKIDDRCAAREARYMLTAKEFWEFEVDSDIRRVRLLDPATLEIVAVTDPDIAGSAERFTLRFRIVDHGRALIHPEDPKMIFRRCPKS